MYQPDWKILRRYADVLVNFALGKGKGIKKGDVVLVEAHENAKPFFVELLRAVTKAGGHTISHYAPDNDRTFNATRDFFLDAKDHQLHFFPSKYYRGLIDE
ncbi:MAG TPA: aminopeptidase, partial [Candidatus Paceibacterota bacterium]|nr:aminopeptidase [Candidatus Paceibacterota bacterium]